jgi:hypothetical protein
VYDGATFVPEDAVMKASILSFALACMLGPGFTAANPVSFFQVATGPSYEDTVQYIQERVVGNFKEKSHCVFYYQENAYHPDDQVIVAFKYVLPLMMFIDEPSAGVFTYRLSCDGKGCAGDGQSGQHENLEFSRDKADPGKVEHALHHMVDLCGGAARKDDIF